MTLQQINYAITIAETGSMNKAAVKLYISQPSLTSSIKVLEKEVGINIFIRSGRGVALTPEGEEFLMYARQVYQQFELLNEKYIKKGVSKKKFGVSTQHYSFAAKVFAETVKQFDTRKFEFAFRETKIQKVLEDVGNFKSEVGVVCINSSNEKFILKLLGEKDLKFNQLVEDSSYVFLYKGHTLAKEKSIGIEQLLGYPYLEFGQDDIGAFCLNDDVFDDITIERSIKVSDRATMLNLIKELNGYTLCSETICKNFYDSDYITVPFKENTVKNSVMKIGYITKKRAVLSEVARVYVEQLQNYFKSTI
ncbi:MAG: LysR family transcriptional regulator [Ruminococcus sp.]|nr:LysR family transcriptional regulator [Ruminococcus sp.]